MNTKQHIINELNNIPEHLLQRLLDVVKTYSVTKPKQKEKSDLKLRDFGGQFDNVDVRSAAYE